MRPRKYPPVTVGERFGAWTVEAATPGKAGAPAHLLCRCDCGNTGKVLEIHFRTGRSSSCGTCARLNKLSAAQRATAESVGFGAFDRTVYMRLRNIHDGVLSRCNNPNDPGYANYGGRGIRMCATWADAPETFVIWAMSQPGHASPNKSLDRVDNDGNYEPGNCRFATQTEQCNNKRNNVIVSFRGERMTATQFGRTHCPSFSSARVIMWLKTNDLDTERLLQHYQRCVAVTPQ